MNVTECSLMFFTIKRVQRRANRLVSNSKSLNYTERLKELDLPKVKKIQR